MIYVLLSSPLTSNFLTTFSTMSSTESKVRHLVEQITHQYPTVPECDLLKFCVDPHTVFCRRYPRIQWKSLSWESLLVWWANAYPEHNVTQSSARGEYTQIKPNQNIKDKADVYLAVYVEVRVSWSFDIGKTVLVLRGSHPGWVWSWGGHHHEERLAVRLVFQEVDGNISLGHSRSKSDM